MFNEQQNKRLTALAFYIDQEIKAAQFSIEASKTDEWLKKRYGDIKMLLSEASNAIREARDIDERGPR